MTQSHSTRRDFLKTTAGSAALGASIPYIFTSESTAADSKNDRLTVASIGVGGRGRGIGNQLRGRGDCVAVCDVDENQAKAFRGDDSKIQIYEDYRKLLDRKDIDAITIGTPDHWHTAILLHALRAGKDVYCEKPMTLTIDEGKLISDVVKETGRIVQVGTQQRTEFNHLFLKAVAIAHSGRLGTIKKVSVGIDGSPKGGPFETQEVPSYFNWDFWLGQTPMVDYIPERTHGHFRWWYEYSGGKMTDWGAHHVDIAQWALKLLDQGPLSVESLSAEHPMPFKDGYPTVDNMFNAAYQFKVRCMFPGEVEMMIHSDDNAIVLEGDQGKIRVNRGRITGKPIEEIQADKKLGEALDQQVAALYNGRKPKGHMDNFLDAVKDRNLPMSDVFTHHKTLTTCHLANIAIRLGRKINWDSAAEMAVGDEDINNNWLKREQRKGYEIS